MPTVVAVRVQGNTRYTDSQLLAALGVRAGQPFDQEAITRGIQTLWRTFVVRADVSYRGVPGGIELLVDVVEMPVDFEPRFVGNLRVKEEELYEWMDLEPGAELYIHQTALAAQRLLDGYRKDGYHFAQVRPVTREAGEGEAPDVIFEIIEGPQVRVERVVIDGNDSMRDKGMWWWKSGLRSWSRLESGKRPFPWLFVRGKFVEETLQSDLVAMRNVYRDRGWQDAVVELDRLEFNEARTRVTIHITIDEGEPYEVGSLRIEALDLVTDPDDPSAISVESVPLFFDEEELLELCEMQPGTVYSERSLNLDQRALREYYGSHGYISHPSLPRAERFEFLEPDLVFDAEKQEVHVTYRLEQGQQHFIREILFAGNRHTLDRVLRRELSIEPGQVADLTKIEDSLRRLRGTGFFNDPRDPFFPPPTYRFAETEDPVWKDLEYSVDEGSVLQTEFLLSAGSTFGVQGTVDLTLRNFDITQTPSAWSRILSEIPRHEAFHGAGQSLRLRVAPGTQTSEFLVRFSDPDIFHLHKDRIRMSLDAQRLRGIWNSHDEQRTFYGFEFGRQLDLDSSVFAGFSFGEVEIDDLDEGGEPNPFSPLSVPEALFDQREVTDLAFVNAGYRRQVLDRFIQPTEGYRIVWENRVYAEPLGSDESFFSSDLTGHVYEPVGDADVLPRSYFHAQFALGFKTAFAGTEDVPYTERFFMGGRDIRGFQRRGVGPNENGHPIGGQTRALLALEYRFPLYSPIQPGTFEPQEILGGAFFFDAGIQDPDEFSLDPDELRASAGFEIGIRLGFIPIRLIFPVWFEEGRRDRTDNFQFRLGN